MDNKTDLKELLDHINPSILDYQTWAEVGMALKYEGYPCSIWEDWSRRARKNGGPSDAMKA